MKITNLDLFNNDDQVIVLDGKEWSLPGEIPVDYVLSLIEFQQKIEENPSDLELFDRMYGVLIELFNKRHPDLQLKQLKRMITSRQTGVLIANLMRSIGGEAETEKKTDGSSADETNM